MSKFFLYTILFLGFATISFGQDPIFTQFYANPLYLGPSFAGAVDGSRISTQYRNQWWDLNSKFVTQSLSYDHYFSSFKSGIGINFISDVAGSSKLGVIQVGLHYSYNLKFHNTWHLRPGLSFSYLQHGVYGEVLFIDGLLSSSNGKPGNSAAPPTALDNTKDIDAGVSLLLYTKGFWFGATTDHLLRPDVTLHAAEAKIPLKTSVYGGYDLRAKGRLLKPSPDMLTFAFLYKQQGPVRQLDLGAYWFTYPVILGIWYRGIPTVSSHRGEAVVFIGGIKTRNFNIGYSYDLTISNMLPHTKGSHEISLTYKFLLPRRNEKGAVPCPEF